MLDIDDIVSTTCFTVLRLAKEKNGGDCMLLYMRYMTQKRIQETSNTHSNDSFMMKAMGWGKGRFASAKSFLITSGLIEPIVRRKEDGTIEGHYVRVKCDVGLIEPCAPQPSLSTHWIQPPSGERETNTIEEKVNTIIDNNIGKPILKNKASPIQTDILSEEIYCTYIKDMPSDKKKYMKKGQSLLYISSLLKTYDNAFLLSCITSYKKTVEPKFWKAPQYFFANTKNTNAKEYMFFLDYAPTNGTIVEEENDEEKKQRMAKALSFFGG